MFDIDVDGVIVEGYNPCIQRLKHRIAVILRSTDVNLYLGSSI